MCASEKCRGMKRSCSVRQTDEQDAADKRKPIQSKGAVHWRPGGSWVMDLGRNKNQDCASIVQKSRSRSLSSLFKKAQLVIRMHYGCNLPIASLIIEDLPQPEADYIPTLTFSVLHIRGGREMGDRWRRAQPLARWALKPQSGTSRLIPGWEIPAWCY